MGVCVQCVSERMSFTPPLSPSCAPSLSLSVSAGDALCSSAGSLRAAGKGGAGERKGGRERDGGRGKREGHQTAKNLPEGQRAPAGGLSHCACNLQNATYILNTHTDTHYRMHTHIHKLRTHYTTNEFTHMVLRHGLVS